PNIDRLGPALARRSRSWRPGAESMRGFETSFEISVINGILALNRASRANREPAPHKVARRGFSLFMRQETQPIAMPLPREIGLNFGLPTHGALPWSKMSFARSYERRRAIKSSNAPSDRELKQIVSSRLLPSG